MKQKKVIKIFAALSQETRLQIFKLLLQEGEEGLSSSVIAQILDIAPATISFHLLQLANAKLIIPVRQGKTILYHAKLKTFKKAMRFLTAEEQKHI